MSNLMDIIRGPIRGLIRKTKSLGRKIEDNLIKISEIKELRRGMGKPKKDDTKGKKLVDNRKEYERDNSQHRAEIRTCNEELKSLIDVKNAVSLCIGSKTYSGGINRYNRMD